MDMYIVTERLALTEDGQRLVPEEHLDARWLYAIPGQEIPLDEAIQYGLGKAILKAAEPAMRKSAKAAATRKNARKKLLGRKDS